MCSVAAVKAMARFRVSVAGMSSSVSWYKEMTARRCVMCESSMPARACLTMWESGSGEKTVREDCT